MPGHRGYMSHEPRNICPLYRRYIYRVDASIFLSFYLYPQNVSQEGENCSFLDIEIIVLILNFYIYPSIYAYLPIYLSASLAMPHDLDMAITEVVKHSSIHPIYAYLSINLPTYISICLSIYISIFL